MPHGPQRLDVAIAAQDNLRSALGWSVASGSVDFGLELATSLERFWVTRDPDEGIRWFAALLDQPGPADISRVVLANALRAYGGAAEMAGLHEFAERQWERSLRLFEGLGDEHGRAVILHRLGISAMRRGDLERARELVLTSLESHERRSEVWGQAQAMGSLGAIERDAGDASRASELIEKSLALARELGVVWWVSGAQAELANLALGAGRIDEAEARARESLAIAEGMGDRPGRVFGIGLLARIAAERGQLERAADLWAAVEHEDAGAPLGGWRRHRESYGTLVLDRLASATASSVDRPRPSLDEAASLALQSATEGHGDPLGRE
jgi:tetratricopeptide (TPR) repeat protein